MFPEADHVIECRDSSPASTSPSTSDLPKSPAKLPIALLKSIRSTRNHHPYYYFLSYHHLSSHHYAFTSSLSSISIPKIVQEALSHPNYPTNYD